MIVVFPDHTHFDNFSICIDITRSELGSLCVNLRKLVRVVRFMVLVRMVSRQWLKLILYSIGNFRSWHHFLFLDNIEKKIEKNDLS